MCNPKSTLHWKPEVVGSLTLGPGIRNDFSSQVHKFLAHLTDAQHKTVGHTVLYVPNEGTAMASPDAHRDKELVQRLEGECVAYAGEGDRMDS